MRQIPLEITRLLGLFRPLEYKFGSYDIWLKQKCWILEILCIICLNSKLETQNSSSLVKNQEFGSGRFRMDQDPIKEYLSDPSGSGSGSLVTNEENDFLSSILLPCKSK